MLALGWKREATVNGQKAGSWTLTHDHLSVDILVFCSIEY